MTTQTNSPETQLVLRLSGGPRDGELFHIDTPKCFLGFNDGVSRAPHCAIYRGSKGASVRSYSGDVLVNGSATSVHWLKAGDRIDLPNSTTVEVSRLGVIETTGQAQPAPEGCFTSKTELSVKDSISSSGIESIAGNSNLQAENERFRALESKIYELQSKSESRDARFNQIDDSLNQISQQMAQLLSISANNNSAPPTTLEQVQAKAEENHEKFVDSNEEVFVTTGQTTEAEETFVTELPTQESNEEVFADASQLNEPVAEQFAEQPAPEETFVTQPPVAEETFVTEITTPAVEEKIVAEFASTEEETIVTYQAEEEETILADLTNYAPEAMTSEVTEVEATEAPTIPEATQGTSQEEIDSRLADLERVFGGTEEPSSSTEAPAQDQPASVQVEPSAVIEPSVIDVPYVEEIVSEGVDASQPNESAELTTEQASLEARLESFMAKTRPPASPAALDSTTNQNPADDQTNESFDQPTHSQNESDSFAGPLTEESVVNNSGPTNPELPEPGSLASQLLKEVLEESSDPIGDVNAVAQDVAQEVVEEVIEQEPANAEGNSLQDVLDRMKETGQWDGLSDDDDDEAFQAPTPIAPPVETPVVQETTSDDGNEDVEDYMSQLLSRMRGDKPGSAKKVEEEKEEEVKEVEKTEIIDQFVPPEEPLKPEDFKPKRKAEKPKSFDAMRALANSASRTNVKKSEVERQKALGLVQIGIAIGSFFLSGYYFLFDSAKLFDMPFLIGVMCLGVCGVFCYRSYGTMKNEEIALLKKKKPPTTDANPAGQQQ